MKRTSYSSCTKLYEIAVRSPILNLFGLTLELLIPLRIKAHGLSQVYEAVCSSYHIRRTNCSKCPTGLVGQRYEIVVAWLSR